MGDALGGVWLGGARAWAQVLPMMATRGCERPGSGPLPGTEAGAGAAEGARRLGEFPAASCI